MSSSGPVVVSIRLFAVYRERIGRGALEVELPDGATVSSALLEVGRRYPQVAPLAANTMVAVNQEYAAGERRLLPGDEVALIPPVSGGWARPDP